MNSAIDRALLDSVTYEVMIPTSEGTTKNIAIGQTSSVRRDPIVCP